MRSNRRRKNSEIFQTMTKLSSKKILEENNTRNPSSIKTLILTHRALADVSCLAEFKILERLDLGSNNLISLEGLKPCVNLKWLSVVQNLLQSLKGIEGLTKLTVLNAGKNKLKSMEEITSVVSLRAIILNDNEIGSICKLDQLKELNTLVLSRNPIRKIGASLAKNKLLTKLSLSNCELETIGSSVTSCTELKELRLAHNDIKILPVELSHNSRLQNLDLGNNSIVKWSDIKVLSSLFNLKNLNLQGNPLSESETTVKKIRKLAPNLQIYNGKPIDQITAKGGEVSTQNSKKTDESKDQTENNPGIDSTEKKSKRKSRLEPIEEQGGFYDVKLDIQKNDKKSKKISKARNKEEASYEEEEDNTYKKQKKEHLGSDEHEEDNGKLKKKSKKSKPSDMDTVENSFLEILGTNDDDADENDLKISSNEDSLIIIPTKTNKNKNENENEKKHDMQVAFIDVSPVVDVGLGGPSTWD